MALTIETTPVPLDTWPDGSVRVRGSRVTLDTVVAAFERGASADEIALQYPTLPWADLYDVITYYLHNQNAVASYLVQHESHAAAKRQVVEQRMLQIGIRERLLARLGRVADPGV